MFHIELGPDSNGVTCAFAVNDKGHTYLGAEAGQTGKPQEAIHELVKLFKKGYPEEQLDANDIRTFDNYRNWNALNGPIPLKQEVA